MKKIAIVGLAASLAVLLGLSFAYAQRGSGWYCPWMGGGGPGMRGGPGWYCPWGGPGGMMGPPVAQPGQPLTTDQAKAMVEQHISANPNLKAGKVTPKDDYYEVEVVTKDGSLVDKIQVNKQTGWFRSGY